jgi:phosphatidate cytidylyltransferase
MSNLVQRLLSAAVIIPILLYLFHKGGTPFIILIEVVIVIGMNEYYRMVEQKALSPDRFMGTLSAVALGAVATTGRLDYMAGAMTMLVLLLLANRLRSLDLRSAVTGMNVTIFGVIYVGWLLSHAILLRNPLNPPENIDLGLFFIVLAIAGTFGADAGAYFTGRAYGKKKLLPLVSPGKTVEGALGGIAGGTIGVIGAKLAFDWFIFPAPGTGMPLVHCILLGPVLVVATIVGDLSQSMMKRDSGIKDSGNIIPGHGGILDRLDSILFAIPLTYYYLRFFVYEGIF